MSSNDEKYDKYGKYDKNAKYDQDMAGSKPQERPKEDPDSSFNKSKSPEKSDNVRMKQICNENDKTDKNDTTKIAKNRTDQNDQIYCDKMKETGDKRDAMKKTTKEDVDNETKNGGDKKNKQNPRGEPGIKPNDRDDYKVSTKIIYVLNTVASTPC